MARIFRQCYTIKAPDGRRVKRRSRKWYIEYRDADRIRRRVAGFTDKQATQQLGADLERKAIMRLAKQADRYTEHCKRPLSEHVKDWRSSLTDRGGTAKHANMSESRTRAVLAGIGATFWPELDADRVTTYLSERRKAGLSVESVNHYARAVKGFARWMVQNRRAPESPLSCLTLLNARTDRRHDRRVLSEDELKGLFDATRTGPTRFGMSGPDRATLYQLAVETGLRAGELRSLTWASLKLDGNPPTVTVNAAYSKHRREDVLPLRPSLAQMLARWRDEKDGVDRRTRYSTQCPKSLPRCYGRTCDGLGLTGSGKRPTGANVGNVERTPF